MSLNVCAVSGNLGKAADLRYTSTGVAVLSFSVAVNERRRQSDGSYSDYANWIDCTMFGKRAESLQPFLAKGTKLALVGHLHKSTWEQNGQRYSKVEIVVDEVELMNTRRDAQQPEGAQAPETVQAGALYDEDIPF